MSSSSSSERVSHFIRKTQWRVAAFALICPSVLLTLAGVYVIRVYEARSMELAARSLALAGEPALRFSDRPAMRELVEKLATGAGLAEVSIVDAAGQPWLTVRREAKTSVDRAARCVSRLLLSQPPDVLIGDASAPLGRMLLRSDGLTLLRFLLGTALSFVGCLALVMVAVLAYSRSLASLIVEPISALSALTREVRESRAFGRRADRVAVKEIDTLATDFNALLGDMERKEAVIQASQSDLRRSNDELRALSRYDPLTKLANRAYLSEHLAELLDAARAAERQVGLLFIDTDRFKEINDRHGHSAGDAMLVELSARLKFSIRDSDFVARLGGDEFIIIISPLRDGQEIPRLTDRIKRSLAKPLQLQEARIEEISVTIGVALFPDHASTAAELVRAADAAMYRAKAIARGSVVTFEAERDSRPFPSASGSSHDQT